MYNHHANANELWYELLNDTPGRVGPPIEPPPADIRQYFRDWMDRDGHPFWPFWENVRTWWEVRDLPNVMFVHFANLKRDMPGQMRRIAEFLDVPIDETRWEEILEYCSFDWMKRNARKSVPLGGAFWDAGAQVFINKGSTAAGPIPSRLRTWPSTKHAPWKSSAPKPPTGSRRARNCREACTGVNPVASISAGQHFSISGKVKNLCQL